METVKLVIWDLDDTFWDGTLSETGISARPENCAAVLELARRGIPSSIASNNDLHAARRELTELDVWDLFVCPQISWRPKGELVRAVIDDVQLRAADVLFIDDNVRNLEAAKHANPGLAVELPASLPTLLTQSRLCGKPDPTLQRLAHYKRLERRKVARQRSGDSRAFLESADIEVRFIERLDEHVERVHELLLRTNQLNFTKLRPDKETLLATMKLPHLKCGGVRVVDKFGDHGLVGFYCLDPGRNALQHFAFSCRILNLGIEQYVYAHLGSPSLEIRGDVASRLDEPRAPSWIKSGIERVAPMPKTERSSHGARILLKGGCDVGLMAHYLERHGYRVAEESGMVEVNGALTPHGHTQELVNSISLSSDEQLRLTEEFAKLTGGSPLGTLDGAVPDTVVWAEDYDVLVYNLMVDYLQQLYRERDGNTIIGYGGYVPVTEDTIEYWVSRSAGRVTHPKFLRYFLDYFVEHYESIGQITAAHLVHNLQFVRERIAPDIPIILLNGVEVAVDNEREPDAHIRHRMLNEALDAFVAGTSNCWLVDVRKHASSRADITDNIRHYQAHVYHSIVDELASLIGRLVARG